ncbi:MAG TPA: hypothetical protein DCL77_04480 [Prolixibacteraceae bacterium]|jgi:hypothetical protein|nr:hypothetical protein [Prolixibacteraceae bacterium]
MNKIFVYFLVIFLFANCKKEDELKESNSFNMATVAEWPTIDFKTGYTIQVPAEYIGNGMVGFEGNEFYKVSPDDKIQLNYYYGSSMHHVDFGDALPFPYPKEVRVTNSLSELVVMDKMEVFIQKPDTIALFYYSNSTISRGRLYWKVDTDFNAALEVDFNLLDLPTVNKIIGTIRKK